LIDRSLGQVTHLDLASNGSSVCLILISVLVSQILIDDSAIGVEFSRKFNCEVEEPSVLGVFSSIEFVTTSDDLEAAASQTRISEHFIDPESLFILEIDESCGL
jgi:hypothetical protein